MGLRDYVPGEAADARPPPPAVLTCKSVRAVSPSVAVSFTAFLFYGNDFGSMTSCFILPESVCVFKQSPIIHETILFPIIYNFWKQ